MTRVQVPRRGAAPSGRFALWLVGWTLACALLVSGCSSGSQAPQGETRKVDLATLWYSWFGFDLNTGQSIGGLGSSHWNTDVGSYGSRVGITDEPKWGFYASDDPVVIARQLQQMMRAGISVVIISWWGWGDHDLDGQVEGDIGVSYNEAITTALQYIKEHKLPIRFAFLVEWFWYAFGALPPGGLSEAQKTWYEKSRES